MVLVDSWAGEERIENRFPMEVRLVDFHGELNRKAKGE